MDEAEITDRLFLPMLLEATRVLEEGIVREPADVDMGLILGIGFPPFRGGILRWCDSQGAGAVLDRLARYAPLGKRFEPTETLVRQARTGETFYPRPKMAAGYRDQKLHGRRDLPMRNAVVIDAVRTPVGRASADKGYFRDVRSEDLSAHVIQAIVAADGHRSETDRGRALGLRAAAGRAGVRRRPDRRARRRAARADRWRDDQPQLRLEPAGDQRRGDEHRRRLRGRADRRRGRAHGPRADEKDYNPCPRLFRRHSEAMMNMGLTAEYLAAKYRIPRGPQDEFALRSHQLAAKATDAGEFAAEIVPTWGRDDAGHKVLLTDDQCIRRETSLEALAALPPAFNPDGGSVTAGNSSPINVGAAALLVMSEEKARELGLKPIAEIRAMAVAGVNPEEMGIGPVPAVRKALKRAGLTLDQIDCIELNEAFAVQVLAVLKLLGISEDKVNTRGGAIAIGPPLGGQRRPDRDHPAPPDARPGGQARPGDHVRRPGTGSGDDL